MYHLHCATCGAFIAATKEAKAAAGTHYCNKHRRPLTEEQLRMLEELGATQGDDSDEVDPDADPPSEETVTGEEVDDTEEEPPADLLPDDFPAVELLRENGLETYTAVAAHPDLTDINGIGQATAERILEALP